MTVWEALYFFSVRETWSICTIRIHSQFSLWLFTFSAEEVRSSNFSCDFLSRLTFNVCEHYRLLCYMLCGESVFAHGMNEFQRCWPSHRILNLYARSEKEENLHENCSAGGGGLSMCNNIIVTTKAEKSFSSTTDYIVACSEAARGLSMVKFNEQTTTTRWWSNNSSKG